MAKDTRWEPNLIQSVIRSFLIKDIKNLLEYKSIINIKYLVLDNIWTILSLLCICVAKYTVPWSI